MLEFKNNLLFKDGVPVLKIIATDLFLDSADKQFEKKLLTHYEQFISKLMEAYIELNTDDDVAMSKLEDTLSKNSSQDIIRQDLFEILNSHADIEKIYKNAYYRFKSEIISGRNIESVERVAELRDAGVDSFSDTLNVGETTSNTVGFFSIFFSSKYRFMSDREIKKELVKSVIIWILLIVSDTLFLIYITYTSKNKVSGVFYLIEGLLVCCTIFLTIKLIRKYYV
ncbi:hypothetical protein [Mucilaginibacter gotjawali]|uniref:Uncharacterized protein n=2 Tax=Mucilaginibacter gotjawali TaxID=1550579 RepID=A0A0X8X487_9SPHI|nr:hypothetical protein [Mucilaginibacter gotjawali]MBB3057467.1 hypothetical protein [Mucilaginibacter gotjawali]BAU55414.1 hypothetical protein MgSA37_03598 [Mucilaginibacter gotjawali]